ncbi:cathepsin Q [Arabidopsis lyrata subsp. lyrata]|nr:cathepsin Q [Arabidopsis lyrata subsp. lyrata]|eukprot:XP_002882415.2 cathepsin Q [Arabidopsis lyrata subsp. lyrata]
MRVQETLHLYENVNADFIRARLNRYPVALIVQVDVKFLKLGQEGVYHLPKKHPITKDTRLHCMLLIGYGVTKEGKTFFIGQNSYGKGWGCKGYAIIIIDKKCDIVCQKD